MTAPFTTSEPGGQAVTAFWAALGLVQIVRKTNEVDTGKYKYTYADLTDVLGEVKRVCEDQGLRPWQVATSVDGEFAIITTLLHSSGEWIEFAPIRLPQLRDPQALGGAITYLRRYALVTIFAMAIDDDDAKSSTEQLRHEQATGSRSGAEERIRETINAAPVDVQVELRQEFRKRFGMGLVDLPVTKHGEALEWVLDWLKPPTSEPAS
jgi:hypothetical protein